MLHTVSRRIVERLYTHCPLEQQKKAIYTYGVEITISTMIALFSVFLFSVATKNLFSFFSFLLCFVVVRLFTGGYHATTYFRCFVLTNAIYLLILFLGLFANYYRMFYVIPLCIIFANLIILRFSPVCNKRHPLSDRRYKVNLVVSRVLVLTWTLILFSLCLFESLVNYLYFPVLALTAVAVMIIPTINERRKINGKRI